MPVPLQTDGRYDDGCYHNMRLSTEVLGSHRHQILSCLTPDEIVAATVSPAATGTWSATTSASSRAVPGRRDHGDRDEMEVPPASTS